MSLFQVYLRLRPPIAQNSTGQATKASEYLTVEPPEDEYAGDDESNQTRSWPTHVTAQPPNESRKRAVEKFAFTKVFEEQASQFDVFQECEMVSMVKDVLEGARDGVVATLGATGSGKV